MNGWELKKALILAKKNNASLFEWMTSPTVYKEDPEFAKQLRELIFAYYNKTWLIDNTDKTFPPPQLNLLVNEVTLPDSVREIISNLIEKKKAGSYLGEGRHSYDLEKWFEAMISTECPEYCKKFKNVKPQQFELLDPLLDKLFYSTVMKYQ
ncbi:unnamed protein product [Rotaria magnacalcarata]|uniref:Uncharacterized protein n=1 Tax=Rotaria magnacalcarata TaxID=392030 RepID=A0A816U5P4_9BILA|nr:unnamed protein product [Rotaria magnacalcarata]